MGFCVAWPLTLTRRPSTHRRVLAHGSGRERPRLERRGHRPPSWARLPRVKGEPDIPDLRVYDGPEWDATIVKLALEDAGIVAVSDSPETLSSRHLHSTVFVRY